MYSQVQTPQYIQGAQGSCSFALYSASFSFLVCMRLSKYVGESYPAEEGPQGSWYAQRVPDACCGCLMCTLGA